MFISSRNMKRNSFLTLCIVFSVISQAGAQTKVINLRCENLNNPLGIEAAQPRLSWQLQSTSRNVLQTSYRVLVADDAAKLATDNGNMWDSKQVTSDQSLWIPYAGKPLQAGKYYYWKVTVWDNKGLSAASVDSAWWQMGLLQAADWSNAKWIGYDELDASKRIVPGIHAPGNKDIKTVVSGNHVLPMLRKSFTITKPVRRATAFVCGLGHYELHINGAKVGDRFLAPGWTNYDKRCLYNTYDVTKQVSNGNNAIGVMLGNGFYNVPNERYHKLLIAYGNPTLTMKLLVEYTDGTKTEIITDNTWKAAQSPITFSSIYAGEEYNANLEQEGWDKAGFNDAVWKAAIIVKAPGGKLVAEQGNPLKAMTTLAAKSVIKTSDSTYLYDFGQNASGIVSIKVKGKLGEQLKLYPAELIGKDKRVNQRNSGRPFYFSYTCKGKSSEEWRPRFTYYGFRYVEVVNAAPDSVGDSKKPAITDMQLVHTYNASPHTGKFECTEDRFDETFDLIDWAIRSNMQSVVTDCPHREKLGWLEQTYLMGESIHYNYDIYDLYKKLVFDMMADQTPDGLVPDITPEYVLFDGGFRDSPEWGSAAVILPWMIYKWYGDRSVMQQAWPMMTKYVDYLGTKANGHILKYGLGDWYDLGPKFPGVAQLTPMELTATAIYYYDISLLSQMARLLQMPADATKYEALAAQVKTAFNSKFFNPQKNVYATGSQTAMAMPLVVGLVDDNNRPAIFKTLVDSISKKGKALTAGDIGFHFLIQALSDGGAAQLVYDMNSRDDVPGYGYQLKKGATALTESWAALEEVSNNHLMLGHLMQWFYDGLAGIRQSDTSVGYKRIEIKPEPVIGVDKGKASFESPYGTIYSEWDHQYSWRVFTISIPANTTATIYLPSPEGTTILESNMPLKSVRDIQWLGYQNGKAVFKAGSGKYKFIIR
jgi:hypothetical protein